MVYTSFARKRLNKKILQLTGASSIEEATQCIRCEEEGFFLFLHTLLTKTDYDEIFETFATDPETREFALDMKTKEMIGVERSVIINRMLRATQLLDPDYTDDDRRQLLGLV